MFDELEKKIWGDQNGRIHNIKYIRWLCFMKVLHEKMRF